MSVPVEESGMRSRRLLVSLTLASTLVVSGTHAGTTGFAAPFDAPVATTECYQSALVPIGGCKNSSSADPSGTMRATAHARGFDLSTVAAYARAGVTVPFPVSAPLRSVTVTVDLTIASASVERSALANTGRSGVYLWVVLSSPNVSAAWAEAGIVRSDGTESVSDTHLLVSLPLQFFGGALEADDEFALRVELNAHASIRGAGRRTASLDAVLNGFSIEAIPA